MLGGVLVAGNSEMTSATRQSPHVHRRSAGVGQSRPDDQGSQGFVRGVLGGGRVTTVLFEWTVQVACGSGWGGGGIPVGPGDAVEPTGSDSAGDHC